MERNEIFDEMLDESYPTVVITGITFFPSDILAECDPIAYRVGLNDFMSSECENGDHHTEDDLRCSWCGENLLDIDED